MFIDKNKTTTNKASLTLHDFCAMHRFGNHMKRRVISEGRVI